MEELITGNSCISLSIPKYFEKMINEKNVNFYTIEIVDHYLYKKWKIDKRYSEFRDFHNVIAKLFPKCPKLPKSTTLFQYFQFDTAESCRKNLEVYLRECNNRTDISNSEELKRFLEVRLLIQKYR